MLATTLASLRAQTYSDLEVLVCDNGDDDDVARLVDTAADSRFRHIRRPENVGIQRNTMLGFHSAAGEFVFKLDDDDLLSPTALEHLAHALRRYPHASLAFGVVHVFHDDPLHTRRHTPALQHEEFGDFAELAAAGAVQLASSLIRKSALGRIEVDPATKTAFDVDILLRLADDGVAVHVPDAHIHYRRHDRADSVTAPGPQGWGALVALNSAIERRPERLRSQAFRSSLEAAALAAARGALREGRGEAARAAVDSLPRDLRTPALAKLKLAGYVPRIARPIAVLAHERYRRTGIADLRYPAPPLPPRSIEVRSGPSSSAPPPSS